MNVVLAKTETGRALSDVFAVARDRLPGAGKVADARRQAFEAYERAGLPHRRIEDWKYTDLRVLMRDVLPLAAAPDAAALKRCRACPEAACHRRRAPAGAGGWRVRAETVRARPIWKKASASARCARCWKPAMRALQAQLFCRRRTADPMVALNSAMMTDGLVIEVADGAVLTQPLHIVHIASGGLPAAMFTRSLLQLGKAASATLVESYIARRWRQGLSGPRLRWSSRSATMRGSTMCA